MKSFTLKSFLFVLPIILLFIGVEAYITYMPNTFYLKSKHLKKNLKTAQILVLGSSHLQNAINPEFLDLNTVNLAYGGQDKQLDSLLFFNYVNLMPKLKFVILEWDYLTFNNKVGENYFRLPWYYRYHSLELYNVSFFDKASLYASEPEFFKNYLQDMLSPNTYKYHINQQGFIINDYPGIFHDLHYDITDINKAVIKELKLINSKYSNDNYTFNNRKIKSIVEYCQANGVIVILVSSPTSLISNSYEISIYKEELDAYFNGYVSLDKVYYINLTDNHRFVIKDFKNFTHLNSDGAKKFSLLLNAELNSLNHIKFD